MSDRKRREIAAQWKTIKMRSHFAMHGNDVIAIYRERGRIFGSSDGKYNKIEVI